MLELLFIILLFIGKDDLIAFGKDVVVVLFSNGKN